MLVNQSIVGQYGYQFLIKTTTCSMVWFVVQGIIHLTWNSTWLSEHIHQRSSGYITLRETFSKSRHPFVYFTIIVLIINYWDIGIILLLQLFLGIPLYLKDIKYITIIHISGIHHPTNRSLVRIILNLHNQPPINNQRYVSIRYGWFSSDTCFWIICDGNNFLLEGSWKLFNTFSVKISNGE